MTTTAESAFQVDIDPELRDEATANLEKIGLILPDFVRLVVTHVARGDVNPVDFMIPNEATQVAMREASEGKVTRLPAGGLRALVAMLNADD